MVAFKYSISRFQPPTQTPTQPSIYKSIRRELLNSLLLESLVTRLDTNTSSFRNVDVFTSLYRISWLFSMGSMREHVYIKEAVYIPFINILKMNVYRSLVWETIELFGNNGCYEDVQMKDHKFGFRLHFDPYYPS